jgi:predicted patatin/cPLA2 family phospholipase
VIYGVNPQRTIEAITNRIRLMASGKPFDDGLRIALVVEGGGMRGALSAAGTVALAELGAGKVFDEVIAVSAGVMNASYMLTNQHQLGMSVYFENCSKSAFLNRWRFWRMLNVDYIIDHVAEIEKPLDLVGLLTVRPRLEVAVCEKNTGKTFLVDLRVTTTQAKDVFRAAMAVPVLYNAAVIVDGVPCIDAGTLIPFPLDDVLARGATDVVVLSTRTPDFVERPPPWMMRRMFSRFHSASKSLMDAFTHRHERAQMVRDLAMGRKSSPGGARIATFCTDREDVQAGTTNVKVTYPAALRYGRSVMRTFGVDPALLTLSLTGAEALLRRVERATA